jgi:hypothetical protein
LLFAYVKRRIQQRDEKKLKTDYENESTGVEVFKEDNESAVVDVFKEDNESAVVEVFKEDNGSAGVEVFKEKIIEGEPETEEPDVKYNENSTEQRQTPPRQIVIPSVAEDDTSTLFDGIGSREETDATTTWTDTNSVVVGPPLGTGVKIFSSSTRGGRFWGYVPFLPMRYWHPAASPTVLSRRCGECCAVPSSLLRVDVSAAAPTCRRHLKSEKDRRPLRRPPFELSAPFGRVTIPPLRRGKA